MSKKYENLLNVFTDKKDGNLAFHVDDDEKKVDENHLLLSKKLGYNRDSLVYMKQVHSDTVLVVKDENYKNPPTCDALITNKPNTPLMVMMADCAGVLFYDDIKKVIAVAHVGRAGAFKNIIKKTVVAMQQEFGVEPKELHVNISANINSCCYEVGSEIFDEAKKLNLLYAMEKKESSFYLDINKIIKNQLISSGIEEQNIWFCNICTCCSKDTHFSYRAEKKTGRFAGIAMLR